MDTRESESPSTKQKHAWTAIGMESSALSGCFDRVGELPSCYQAALIEFIDIVVLVYEQQVCCCVSDLSRQLRMSSESFVLWLHIG